MCLCGTLKSKKLFQSGQFGIVQCLACGQVWTEAPVKVKRKSIYGAEDIAVYVEKEAMFRTLFRNVISFIKRFQTRGTLVEIGAGVGLLVDEANKAGFDAIGFEPSKAAVAAARKHFGVKLINYEFHKATPSPSALLRVNPRSDLWNLKRGIDVVVVNHVLEHLEQPKQFLADVSHSIRDGGFLFIGVPNFGSFMAKLKQDRWQSLIPDQHRWHFTLSTLDALVTPFGFKKVGTTYENHVRSMHPWWKRPFYVVLDTMALATGKGEAMLVAYQKV